MLSHLSPIYSGNFLQVCHLRWRSFAPKLSGWWGKERNKAYWICAGCGTGCCWAWGYVLQHYNVGFWCKFDARICLFLFESFVDILNSSITFFFSTMWENGIPFLSLCIVLFFFLILWVCKRTRGCAQVFDWMTPAGAFANVILDQFIIPKTNELINLPCDGITSIKT